MKSQKRCQSCGTTFTARPYARHCSERCRKSEGDDIAARRLATKRRMRERMKAPGERQNSRSAITLPEAPKVFKIPQ